MVQGSILMDASPWVKRKWPMGLRVFKREGDWMESLLNWAVAIGIIIMLILVGLRTFARAILKG